ncbi:E3 ubiquitin-protein ligase RHF2A isoform X2 [Punica granatum]|uniref:RING-type E3 ubiquitin transferase n=1 Tax=Punica granatum TaxID=22663 RepID=A0A6P8DTC2_PUNGR|nr:E3 ubiquitin-protein ligase RHF2A isoform X2 [Punica granatum]
MEDTRMENSQETVKSEAHLTSAAAFVEGGIQDACDDACSICLEAFCDSDPSTVTTCKHEFHLQCILEWCQRSSQCPMCWQPISLKDPTSQELLEVVERERSFRFNPSRNATIFHHPTLGDFELQHLPVGANDAELEERIIQHLAAAAAMGRARHVTRREGRRTRISGHGRPHFLVFSANPDAPPSGPAASSPAHGGSSELVSEGPVVASSASPINVEDSPIGSAAISSQAEQGASSPSRSSPVATSQQGPLLNTRRSPGHSSPNSQERAGPSELQSFSESLKSRFNAVSTRCKESITKSTRGWKERLFTRNTSMADLSSEVRREVNAGIATVSRMMERLETREGKASSSVGNSSENVPVLESSSQQNPEATIQSHPNDTNTHASCAAGSCSS